MKRLLIGAVAAGFALLQPSAVTAQGWPGDDECINCYSCYHPVYLLGHWTDSPVEYEGTHELGEDEDDHFQCWEGPCESEHPSSFSCDGLEDSEDGEKLAAALPAFRRALEQSDVAGLVTLAQSPESGDRLRYLSGRDAVQVVGCTGEILAHIPVSRAIDATRADYLISVADEWIEALQQ